MSKTVMVVDDDPACCYATRMYFEGNGFRVTEAEDGASAMRMLDTGPPPDVIILDIMMPRISGLDLLEHLQGNPETQRIPVVMLSALGDAPTEALSWLAGCDWYQVKSKPVRYDDLLLVIQRILAARASDGRA